MNAAKWSRDALVAELSTARRGRRGFIQTIAAACVSLLATVTLARTPDLHGLSYAGPASALESLDAEINAARTDRAKTARIASDLLAQLDRHDNTVAARQAICQRLGWLLPAQNGPSVPASWAPLVRMLIEPVNVDFARLALEPVSGAAVDALFVEALQHPESADAAAARLRGARDSGLGGRADAVRQALLQSVAKRRIASAVPIAAQCLNSIPGVSAAAARALGAIGTEPALDALMAPSGGDKDVIAAAILASIGNPATGGPDSISKERALRVAEKMSVAADVPVGIRCAALTYVLGHAREDQAIRETLEILHTAEWPMKEAAIGTVATSRIAGVFEGVSRELPSFDAPTQVALLAAVGRRGDPRATNAAIAALGSPVADVRLAAIDALGEIRGSRPAAAALLKLMATNSAIEESKAARLSLARMSGREPDAEIVATAKSADAKSQVAAVEQLALRNVQDALPLLRELRSAAESTVRSAAASAIGEIGPTSDQPLLIAWALQATDEDERSHVLRALVSLTRRIHRNEAAQPIWRALETAPPEVTVRAAPVLSRLGDGGSAACAAQLATGANSAVATAAANTLARWPDVTALDAQVTVATKATDPTVRRTAFRAAVAAMDRAVDRWSQTRTAAVERLASASDDENDAAALLRLLRRASDSRAEAVAGELGRNPKLAAAAHECIEAIQSNRSHRIAVKTSGGWGLADMLDGNAGTNWSIAATPGQWVQLDFGQVRPVARLILDQGARSENMPGTLEIFVTNDPALPGAAVKTQAGQMRRTTIDLPAGSRGRYVILKNTTERIDGYWSIAELIVE